MRKCPYCAEDILDAAIKCKHCSESVGNREKNSVNVYGETLKSPEMSKDIDGLKYAIRNKGTNIIIKIAIGVFLGLSLFYIFF